MKLIKRCNTELGDHFTFQALKTVKQNRVSIDPGGQKLHGQQENNTEVININYIISSLQHGLLISKLRQIEKTRGTYRPPLEHTM